MVQPQNLKTIILTGPTATGKSSLAIEVAKKLGLEIINADSVCFYQGFDIGSAKPSRLELNEVPHHLIDVVSPDENYHAGQFYRDCLRILDEIHARGKRALIVGGSGFYLKALRLGLWDAPATSPEFRLSVENQNTDSLFAKLQTLDPHHAKKIGANDRYRIIRALEIVEISGKKPSELEAQMNPEPDPRFELWVVDRAKDELSIRMRQRIQAMLDAGWIEEVTRLRKKYPHSKTLHAVGYQQILDYLDGVMPSGRKIKAGLDGLMDEIELSHRQLAKQQRTFFNHLKPNETFALPQDLQRLTEKLIALHQK